MFEVLFVPIRIIGQPHLKQFIGDLLFSIRLQPVRLRHYRIAGDLDTLSE
jgi:hypothetical protein